MQGPRSRLRLGSDYQSDVCRISNAPASPQPSPEVESAFSKDKPRGTYEVPNQRERERERGSGIFELRPTIFLRRFHVRVRRALVMQ